MKAIEVVGYKCKKCGKLHYPFHDRCLECKGREFEEVKFGHNAKLVTYTAIFNLPWGFDQRFLVLGVAEFENGLKAMGQIEAEGVEELQLGMPVEARWEPVRQVHGENVYGFRFHPR